MDKIDLLDTVKLLEDIPDKAIRAGTVGTVVDTIPEAAFLVDFSDEESDELRTHWLLPRQLALDMARSAMTGAPSKFEIPAYNALHSSRFKFRFRPISVDPRPDFHGLKPVSKEKNPTLGRSIFALPSSDQLRKAA